MTDFQELAARARARGNAELVRAMRRFPIGAKVRVNNEFGTNVETVVTGHELNGRYRALVVTADAGVAYTYELEVIE